MEALQKNWGGKLWLDPKLWGHKSSWMEKVDSLKKKSKRDEGAYPDGRDRGRGGRFTFERTDKEK